MGNDGGSIPKRRELVKNAARAPTISELKATALESLSHAWTHCALSGAPLDLDAVVSDWRGRLYNYEAILHGLMPSEDATPDAAATPASLGIRSLRDVATLKFAKTGDKWTCPISMKEMGPATKAVYLVPCGHVFAEVAIKEIKEKACPECGVEFLQKNVVTILPTTEAELERLQNRIDDLRASGQTHTLKKAKTEKKKKRKGDDVKQEESEGARASNGGDENGNERKSKATSDPRISGINNSMAASLTAKVLAEQDEVNKRRKLVSGPPGGRSGAVKS
jgi:hypothetical protein